MPYKNNCFLLALHLGICDFESIDLCGYVNDPTNTIDWRRFRAATDSSLPSTDVTYGSSHGHFMLLKSNSSISSTLKSRLVTPSYPDTSGSCIRWYMLLENNATLNVRTYAFGTINPKILYTLQGTQGSRWKLAQTTVRSGSPYQVVFEGILANGDDSVAIDDVEIRTSECDALGSCNFENGLCGFQYLEADFDWKRTTYNIELYGAPQFDHTTNSHSGLFQGNRLFVF